jgi:uncharacterized membrane protein YdbT with pleckstrin-like domain
MAFPRRLIADHEKIIFELRPHWVALLVPVLWAVVILAALILVYSFSDNGTVDNVGAVVALVAILVFGVVPFMRWFTTLFVLTTDRLITRSGIIAKHSKEIPLERINDITFRQRIIERMLGAGDLLIESAGEQGQTRISNVRNPEQVQLIIYKESEENQNRMMRGGQEPPGTSIPEQIEALARLKDQGVLSETEFETKKQELLKRL